MTPSVTPAALQRLPEAFDHPDWIFELKYDGYRALAFVEPGRSRLVSRKGHIYRQFQPLVAELNQLGITAILDGEVVCLDPDGRPNFLNLLYHRKEPCYYAFDCLSVNGVDLRDKALLDRKAVLEHTLPKNPAILYARHIERRGLDMFRETCLWDLEGIVAKYKHGAYGQGWLKIKNPDYSQGKDRWELFGRNHGTRKPPGTDRGRRRDASAEPGRTRGPGVVQP